MSNKAIRELVEACETEFTDEETEERFGDDEQVSFPSSNITFGMIRAARKELDGST